jgi:hypothetical protein
MVLLLAAAAMPLAAATSEPASEPAIGEAEIVLSTQPATTAPADPEDRIQQIYDALQLPENEASAYESAISRSSQVFNELAMKMILRRIQKFPHLTRDEARQLDLPGMYGLLHRPQHYALQPIRMNVFVWTVVRLEPGSQLAATPYWTKDDGPIWYWFCYNADARKFENEPIVILTSIDPNTIMGKPKAFGPNGEISYQSSQPLQITGVFYKLFKSKGARTDTPLDYPVVLAWQVETGRGGEGNVLDIKGSVWVVVGILIVVTFLFMRNYAKRFKKPPAFTRRVQEEEPPEDEEPVSEDLKKAAEQFRKERSS